MNRIKEVLKQRGIKQTWLARRLEKSYNMVNAYVLNRRQTRLETLMERAEILDVDVRELPLSNLRIKIICQHSIWIEKNKMRY